METTPYKIVYEFRFDDETRKRFEVPIDPVKIVIARPRSNQRPEWTKLGYHSCEGCPLDPAWSPYCPVALNITDLVDVFKDTPAHTECLVICATPERSYVKRTTVQEGLFSLLGLIMAVSKCPAMKMFKPMARFHLPFATIQETMVRSISIYLLRQYFEHKKNRPPDMDLKGLDRHYADIQKVNRGILDRIASVGEQDADKNALIILKALADLFPKEIRDNLNSLEYLFELQPPA